MQRENAQVLQADLVHGHSRITWLMDELDAHLRGLTEVPDAADLILDEFVSYWTQFRDELRDHIEEEETELFPLVSTCAGHQRERLAELRGQHARLLVALDSFEDAVFELLGADPATRSTHVERLATNARELREQLATHSRDERTFLSDVRDRIADGCLSA